MNFACISHPLPLNSQIFLYHHNPFPPTHPPHISVFTEPLQPEASLICFVLARAGQWASTGPQLMAGLSPLPPPGSPVTLKQLESGFRNPPPYSPSWRIWPCWETNQKQPGGTCGCPVRSLDQRNLKPTSDARVKSQFQHHLSIPHQLTLCILTHSAWLLNECLLKGENLI